MKECPAQRQQSSYKTGKDSTLNLPVTPADKQATYNTTRMYAIYVRTYASTNRLLTHCYMWDLRGLRVSQLALFATTWNCFLALLHILSSLKEQLITETDI